MYGENPGIFTEASCYLKWVADSYGLQVFRGHSEGCRGESGDQGDVDKLECRANNQKNCTFNTGLSFNVTDGVQVFSYNKSEGNVVSVDQCRSANSAFDLSDLFSETVLSAQVDFGVQLIYFCYTWEDDLFDDCCANDDSKECVEWAQVKGSGYVRVLYTLAFLCANNGNNVYGSDFTECCNANAEYSDLCKQWEDISGEKYLPLFATLFNKCGIDNNDAVSVCPNNCLGVDAADIVVGGSAILATTALTALSASSFALTPALAMLGIGVAGLGVGGMMVAGGLCMGPLYCVTPQGTCCLLVFAIQGLLCPSSC